MNDELTIIEINGVKLEVDLREARRVDVYKIGSKVKVLKKEYSDTKVHHGVIVGFDDFKSLPTMIVCYLDVSYSETNLKFSYINSASEGIEITASHDDFPVDKAPILEQMQNAQDKLQKQIEEIEHKKAYFLEHFEKHFMPETVDVPND